MIQTFSYVLLVMIGLGAVKSTAALVNKCKEFEHSGRALCHECEKVGDSDAVIRLTAKEMRDHVNHLEPLKSPGMGSKGIRGSGTVRLEIWFDHAGNVSRTRAICGHPIALSVAMRAVPKWTFKPLVKKGVKKGGCGIVTIKYRFQNREASTKLQ
jgi:hypothetical protein